ncbi:hypothetical protein [Zoogloea sp. 1C4]|jgi:hypothetical protein|uniref:hypothetical protein n=1 Tax=Zoogloea sp. 1C4 TaxID=2570190 RepID=UPI001291F681|nr:hypothetical protein [Zoogloea sp. 1C4]
MSSENNPIRFSLTRDELHHWAAESSAFCGLDLSRISILFLAQVFVHELTRHYSTFDITDPIKALEGVGRGAHTAAPNQFKHPPLAGLHKVHFFSPRFLARNLLNVLKSKEGARNFERIWNEGLKQTDSEYVTEELIGYIAHHSTVTAFEDKSRARALTGEWIVFHQYEGRNYYLTLATHTQSNEEIYGNVLSACRGESFPFTL